MLKRAAASGDPVPMFELAVLHLRGKEIERDLPAARGLLRRSAAAGHADAALLEVSLTANGAGAPRDFEKARRLLAIAARTDDLAASHLALIDRMEVDANGHPTGAPVREILQATPEVTRFPALLTPAECEHLRSCVEQLLRPSVVVDPVSGRQIAHPVRRSDSATIGPTRESLVVAAINLRIAAATGTDVDQGEPLTILRYGPGQEFRSHLDVLPGENNQRSRTVIVYLNDGYAGGRTRFDATGLKISPRAGDAISFHNVLKDGTCDAASRHTGLPVERGTKWIATRWIRAKTLDPWRTAVSA